MELKEGLETLTLNARLVKQFSRSPGLGFLVCGLEFIGSRAHHMSRLVLQEP